MNGPKFQYKAMIVTCVVVLLAGCAAPTAALTVSPTFPPPPATTLPPPPQPTLLSPPTPALPAQPGGQLFKLVQTVQITPDPNYLTGAFARINYVPATDHFVVTFGGILAQPPSGCGEKGFAYKEYTTEMQETEKTGVF